MTDDDPQSAPTGGEEEAVEPVVTPPDVEGDAGAGLQRRGTVTAVETVDAGEVPTGYPVDVSSERAVALEVSLGGPDDPPALVYFDAPVAGVDGRLGRLLDLAGIGRANPRDIEGETILVGVKEGYYLPVLPAGPPRGSPLAVYGVLLGLAPSLVIAVAGIFAPGTTLVGTTPFVLAWFVCTFLVLPASVYVDALALRSRTDWTGTPRIWAILSAIPALNVLVVPLYLLGRRHAEPLV